MTDKEDIMRMAREAGLSSPILLQMYGDEDALCDSEIANLRQIEHFATLVAAAQKEACAKVLDEMAAQDKHSNYYVVAARAIRAGGNT